MIRKLLEDRVSNWTAIYTHKGETPHKYLSIMERAVLVAGREMVGSPLPSKYSRGVPKECFQNSRRLASKRRGLYYHEGFVARHDFYFPIHHGWCVNRDGLVIDVTLDRPEECEYLGVPFTFTEIKQWRPCRK